MCIADTCKTFGLPDQYMSALGGAAPESSIATCALQKEEVCTAVKAMRGR
jgi:hypothetical protein